MVPEIKKCLIDKDTIIEKATYDAFHDTNLNERISVLGMDTVVVIKPHEGIYTMDAYAFL